MVTTFTLWGVSHDEVGDVDNNAVNNNNTEGELLKLCMSDALKRGAMRHGIGLHLWTGDITEEEHYYTLPKQDTVEVTKIDKRKKENKTTEEVKAITEESIAKFEQDIGYNKETSLNNAKQIAKIIEGFGLPKDIENKTKQTSFTQFISQGNDKDVEKWDNNTIGQYLDLFEQLANEMADNSNDTDIVEEVFGEVSEKVERKCPECDKADWIEDNRQKKADEPEKFGKIPSWSCSTYQGNQGCGWVAWGDTDCPKEWL